MITWLTIEQKLLIESIEIYVLTIILWYYWKKESWYTRIWGLAMWAALGIDLFWFHAVRPSWVGVVLNIPLGAGIFIYEKIKRPIIQAGQVCLAFVLSLFR